MFKAHYKYQVILYHWCNLPTLVIDGSTNKAKKYGSQIIVAQHFLKKTIKYWKLYLKNEYLLPWQSFLHWRPFAPGPRCWDKDSPRVLDFLHSTCLTQESLQTVYLTAECKSICNPRLRMGLQTAKLQKITIINIGNSIFKSNLFVPTLTYLS